jgi:Type II secretion system protein B
VRSDAHAEALAKETEVRPKETDMSDEASEVGGSESQSHGGESPDLANALGTPGETVYVGEAPRKTLNKSTMMFLGLLLAAGGTACFMYLRGGPSSASASTTKEAAAANETITQFLGSGDAKLKSMERMLKDTEKVVQQFLRYPSATQIPLSDLQTNPFRHQSQKPAQVAKTEANEKKRLEEERQLALQTVGRLQLQSIMHGTSRRACMINNTLYQEGQEVESFTIENINSDAVIVKSGAYRFELRMQR